MARQRTGRLVLDLFSIVINIFLNIIFYIVVVYLIIHISGHVYNFSYQVFGDVSVTKNSEKYVDFKVDKGESTMSIAGRLESMNLIVNKYSFYARSKLSKKNILDGEYKLSSDMNYREILNILSTKTKKAKK